MRERIYSYWSIATFQTIREGDLEEKKKQKIKKGCSIFFLRFALISQGNFSKSRMLRIKTREE